MVFNRNFQVTIKRARLYEMEKAIKDLEKRGYEAITEIITQDKFHKSFFFDDNKLNGQKNRFYGIEHTKGFVCVMRKKPE
jgi:hypothetical protein